MYIVVASAFPFAGAATTPYAVAVTPVWVPGMPAEVWWCRPPGSPTLSKTRSSRKTPVVVLGSTKIGHKCASRGHQDVRRGFQDARLGPATPRDPRNARSPTERRKEPMTPAAWIRNAERSSERQSGFQDAMRSREADWGPRTPVGSPGRHDAVVPRRLRRSSHAVHGPRDARRPMSQGPPGPSRRRSRGSRARGRRRGTAGSWRSR